jgi:4-alpha-glucanotransferase
VYTGTHDNATTRGWWESLDQTQRARVGGYLAKADPDIPWDLIRLAMASVAHLCIVPCQDLLGLDEAARFNRPGQATGNWCWRLDSDQLAPALAGTLRTLTETYGRLPRTEDTPCGLP